MGTILDKLNRLDDKTGLRPDRTRNLVSRDRLYEQCQFRRWSWTNLFLGLIGAMIGLGIANTLFPPPKILEPPKASRSGPFDVR